MLSMMFTLDVDWHITLNYIITYQVVPDETDKYEW